MMPITINTTNANTVQASFDLIAKNLFNNYRLKVNDAYYRLLDIEFYYYAEGNYLDVYTHQHKQQLNSGKWYFHGSGIDITIGNKTHHGGILIRAIAKISEKGDPNKYFIENEIHGPLKVKTEICDNLLGAFEEGHNTLYLEDISSQEIVYFTKPDRFFKTKRIGLNAAKEGGTTFHEAKLRYVIFPSLKLKDKTQIARDMLAEGLEIKEINSLLGSKFL